MVTLPTVHVTLPLGSHVQGVGIHPLDTPTPSEHTHIPEGTWDQTYPPPPKGPGHRSPPPPIPSPRIGTSHGWLCAGDWCVETDRCIPPIPSRLWNCRCPACWEQMAPCPPGPVKNFRKDPRYQSIAQGMSKLLHYFLNPSSKTHNSKYLPTK